MQSGVRSSVAGTSPGTPAPRAWRWIAVALISHGAVYGCGAEQQSPPSGAKTSASAPDGEPQDLTEQQRAAIKALEAIGYTGGVRQAGSEAGVTLYDRERVAAGLNLLVSGHDTEAFLLDMEGRVLHRWFRSFHDVWPGVRTKRMRHVDSSTWRRARVMPNGDLFAIYEGLGLIKLDKHSNVLWAYDGHAHHDLDFGPDGRIYVLTRKAHIVPRFNEERPILEDFIAVLDAHGNELERVSLLECFENSTQDGWRARAVRGGDVFHTNTLQYLDGRNTVPSAAFSRGNLLVSLLQVDMIAVIDLERRTVPWALKGPWREQHEPVLLDSGNILLFDNKGEPERSAVLELDALTGEISWSYRADQPMEFYSATCGSVQRLPNGNTLVSETEAGRAFELTPDKAVVWEYVSPYRWPEGEEIVAVVYEMVRLPADFPTDWID